jgi:4-amino-4-deoxy-L-arabinose transferase-like glycosyltransferase
VAAAFYSLTPIAVFFGRVMLPEPLMYALIPLAIWQLVVWAKQDPRARRAFWLALVASSLAAALKITTLHLEAPILAACLMAHGWRALRRAECWALLLVPPLVVLAWYSWAFHLGQAYYSHFPILGERAKHAGLFNPNLWLKGESNFYRRFEVVTLVLVGNLTGWLLAPLALRAGGDRRGRIVSAWFGVTLLQLLVLSGATISHYYYNLAFMLPLALLIGRGADRWERPRLRALAAALAVAGPLLCWISPLLGHDQILSWYKVRPGEVQAAAELRDVSAPTDFVYTLAFGPQMLYEADRRGDFMLANDPQLNPEAIEQAAEAGFTWFATGRVDVLRQPEGQALLTELERWPRLHGGVESVVLRLR